MNVDLESSVYFMDENIIKNEQIKAEYDKKMSSALKCLSEEWQKRTLKKLDQVYLDQAAQFLKHHPQDLEILSSERSELDRSIRIYESNHEIVKANLEISAVIVPESPWEKAKELNDQLFSQPKSIRNGLKINFMMAINREMEKLGE